MHNKNKRGGEEGRERERGKMGKRSEGGEGVKRLKGDDAGEMGHESGRGAEGRGHLFGSFRFGFRDNSSEIKQFSRCYDYQFRG